MLIYPVSKQNEEISSVESLVNERCRHGGAVVITVAPQQGGCGFNPGLRLHGFSMSTPAFSHSPKTYVLSEFGTQICLWDLEWHLFCFLSFYVALWWTDDLCQVYLSLTTGIGPNRPPWSWVQEEVGIGNGWMETIYSLSSPFLCFVLFCLLIKGDQENVRFTVTDSKAILYYM